MAKGKKINRFALEEKRSKKAVELNNLDYRDISGYDYTFAQAKYNIEHNEVNVFVHQFDINSAKTSCLKLTRRELEKMLAMIDAVEKEN